MQKAIEALGRIQKLDLEIKDIKDKEEALALKAQELGREGSTIEAQLAAIDAELGALEATKRDINEKIRLSSDKISSDEKKTGSIKNQKELGALTKEISSATKAKKACEQEIEGLSSKTSNLSARKAELEAKLAEITAARATILGDLERTSPERIAAIAAKEGEKASIAASISPTLVKQYESIRAKRNGRAIATVVNETCQGCFIDIPPQAYIQLKRGDDALVSCPHCHRLLYYDATAIAVH